MRVAWRAPSSERRVDSGSCTVCLITRTQLLCILFARSPVTACRLSSPRCPRIRSRYLSDRVSSMISTTTLDYCNPSNSSPIVAGLARSAGLDLLDCLNLNPRKRDHTTVALKLLDWCLQLKKLEFNTSSSSSFTDFCVYYKFLRLSAFKM